MAAERAKSVERTKTQDRAESLDPRRIKSPPKSGDKERETMKKEPSAGQNKSLPVYDSVEQCSSATKIPVSILKQAEKDGCEAFRNQTVDLEKLLKFLMRGA